MGLMIRMRFQPKVLREPKVSPTVFREQGFRFFFYSREEPRMHVHVRSANGDTKFWLEPSIELAENYGLRSGEIAKAHKLIEEHSNEIRLRWEEHFGS